MYFSFEFFFKLNKRFYYPSSKISSIPKAVKIKILADFICANGCSVGDEAYFSISQKSYS